ncbi:MAG: hypothetical protein IJ333_01425 [Clostridia bacterium]|nr:hypothetical protein [Clostridia bacterium]
MKIYVKNKNSNVELLCTKQELDVLIALLLDFQCKINRYLENNIDKSNLGFTHMHFQDGNKLWKKGDADIVFYVDLDSQSDQSEGQGDG